MRYREITEAPIADFQFIDKSDELDVAKPQPPIRKRKAGSSFQPDDLKAVQSDKWKTKLVTTFRKTPYPVNIYVYNAGSLLIHKGRESKVSSPKDDAFYRMENFAGTYNQRDFRKTFGFLPPKHESSINVLLIQNEAGERVPLTPWIVAHRMIHAFINDDSDRPRQNYSDIFDRAWLRIQDMYSALSYAWEKQHDYFDTIHTGFWDRADMYAACSTLTSARTRKIARAGEFSIELITQWFLTGDFTIKLDWATRKVPKETIKRIREHEVACKKWLTQGLQQVVGKLIVF